MYKIVIDSCGELPEELKQDGHYETVSLELEVDGCRIKDDSTFNQLDFLRRVKESMKGPKSSCPSPEQYMDAYEGEADHVYVVTLSGGLSGSYNSAVLGKNLYEEEHGDAKKIYVFNSKSASIGGRVHQVHEHLFCIGDIRDIEKEWQTFQPESIYCQFIKYQACYGLNEGGINLPVRSGARHEQGA